MRNTPGICAVFGWCVISCNICMKPLALAADCARKAAAAAAAAVAAAAAAASSDSSHLTPR